MGGAIAALTIRAIKAGIYLVLCILPLHRGNKISVCTPGSIRRHGHGPVRAITFETMEQSELAYEKNLSASIDNAGFPGFAFSVGPKLDTKQSLGAPFSTVRLFTVAQAAKNKQASTDAADNSSIDGD